MIMGHNWRKSFSNQLYFEDMRASLNSICWKSKSVGMRHHSSDSSSASSGAYSETAIATKNLCLCTVKHFLNNSAFIRPQLLCQYTVKLCITLFLMVTNYLSYQGPLDNNYSPLLTNFYCLIIKLIRCGGGGVDYWLVPLFSVFYLDKLSDCGRFSRTILPSKNRFPYLSESF